MSLAELLPLVNRLTAEEREELVVYLEQGRADSDTSVGGRPDDWLTEFLTAKDRLGFGLTDEEHAAAFGRDRRLEVERPNPFA